MALVVLLVLYEDPMKTIAPDLHRGQMRRLKIEEFLKIDIP